MKRLLIISLLLCMCGCAKQVDYETVSDYYDAISVEPAEMLISLPDDAAVTAMDYGVGNRIYICENYCIETYTLPAGDIDRSIQEVTGFRDDDILVISTQKGGLKRYECSWTSAGEGELQVCRATILDDGNYHYVLSAMGDRISAPAFSDQWQTMFQSYGLKYAD